MKVRSLPQIYRHLNRWREIFTVLSKYGLAGWISRFDSNFAKDLLKGRDGAALARHSREVRIRLALTELGPTFVKLGQILSTRPDLVGPVLTAQLRLLQDEVPGDPPDVVRTVIEDELGLPLEDVFDHFEMQPLASASIGQVHRARLKSGEAVVVKVQHAGIEQRIRVDLDIMSGLAILAERRPELAAYRPRAIFAEFQRALRKELDFEREARNLRQFAAAFAKDPTVRIPRPYPACSSVRVLTMELLEGVRFSDAKHARPGRFDMDEVARRGAKLYLQMIFSHGCYHADPHPGNLLLLDGDVIGLLDFGMIGRIDETLREEAEDLLTALVTHDATLLTHTIVRMGSVPDGLDHAALNADLTEFASHYATVPLDEFDMSGALGEMLEMIRRYQIVLPSQVAMLIKVLVMLEGTSRLASPHFSLMQVMKPYQRSLLWRRLSPTRRARKLHRIYRELERLAEVAPRRLSEIMQQVQNGKFDVHLDHRGLEPSVNRLVLGLLASALFLGSSLLLSQKVPPLVNEISLLGISGCTVALALGLRLLRAINKSGHLDSRK